MFELLVVRNMDDYAGGDIPIVITTWKSEETDAAFEYWTELSKGEWSDEERAQKCKLSLQSFKSITESFDFKSMKCLSRFCIRLRPCFHQADLLILSLLSDPEDGYVPRFIVFFSTVPKSRGRALFIDASFCPHRDISNLVRFGRLFRH